MIDSNNLISEEINFPKLTFNNAYIHIDSSSSLDF